MHRGRFEVVVSTSNSALSSSLSVLTNTSGSVSSCLHSDSGRMLTSKVPSRRVDGPLATEVTSTRYFCSIIVLLLYLILLRIAFEVLELILSLVARPSLNCIVVEGGSGHRLHLQAHLLGLFKDSLKTINQILMVLVTLKHIES
jgi:hypothetical protein